MNRPTVRQLEYLVAVADHLHFGDAARASAVTQPALSAQIKQLEDNLGVQLFERSRRGTVVTPAGEAVIARARLALRSLDDVLDAARSCSDPLAGPVRLGVIPTMAPYLLPDAYPLLRRRFPELRLILTEDQTDRIVDRLREGSLDVVFLALPVPGDDLVSQALFEEPFVLAAPESHSLAEGPPPAHPGAIGKTDSPAAGFPKSDPAHGSEAGSSGKWERQRAFPRMRLAELEDAELLLLEDGHCLRDQALEVCEMAGAGEQAVRATSMTTLVQMVAAGLGATLLPASAVPVETQRAPDIRVRPFEAPAPTRTIGLMWRKASPCAEAYAALGEALSEAGEAVIAAAMSSMSPK